MTLPPSVRAHLDTISEDRPGVHCICSYDLFHIRIALNLPIPERLREAAEYGGWVVCSEGEGE